MLSQSLLFIFFDLAGAFVFALSGAAAAKARNFDLFGIVAVAFVVACGGGVLRDVCLGAVPPQNISDWRYLCIVLCASGVSIFAWPAIRRLRHPVLWFDAIGLGLFSVSGAHKALLYGSNVEAAVILGTVTAVGGGIMRDILMTRAPAVFQREIYASAALIGATLQVIFETHGIAGGWTAWLSILTCVGLRILSLQYHWHLPRFARRQ